MKHLYSLEEVYDIWEADWVPEQNEAIVRKRTMDEIKLKRGDFG